MIDPRRTRAERGPRSLRRAGFTVIEVMIGLTILALLATNMTIVMNTSSSVYEAGVLRGAIENQASLTMDRIALALMSSAGEGLEPLAEAPYATSILDYDVSLGSLDGQMVWGDPERIELQPMNGQIVWTQRPDEPDSRSLVWSRWATDYLEGETFNGLDDNDNELQDEGGLSFSMEGNKVLIHLTLERMDDQGETYTKTLTTRVTCRN